MQLEDILKFIRKSDNKDTLPLTESVISETKKSHFNKGILDALFSWEKNNMNKSKDYAEGFDFIINEVVDADRYEDVFVWKDFYDEDNN